MRNYDELHITIYPPKEGVISRKCGYIIIVTTVYDDPDIIFPFSDQSGDIEDEGGIASRMITCKTAVDIQFGLLEGSLKPYIYLAVVYLITQFKLPFGDSASDIRRQFELCQRM